MRDVAPGFALELLPRPDRAPERLGEAFARGLGLPGIEAIALTPSGEVVAATVPIELASTVADQVRVHADNARAQADYGLTGMQRILPSLPGTSAGRPVVPLLERLSGYAGVELVVYLVDTELFTARATRAFEGRPGWLRMEDPFGRMILETASFASPPGAAPPAGTLVSTIREAMSGSLTGDAQRFLVAITPPSREGLRTTVGLREADMLAELEQRAVAGRMMAASASALLIVLIWLTTLVLRRSAFKDRYLPGPLTARSESAAAPEPGRAPATREFARGLAGDEFFVAYLPRFDIRSGDVCGFEAQPHWNHPHRGMVPPGDFIALAEESGLIADLWDWVLDRAVDQVGQWHRQGQGWHKVSAHVPPLQLRSGDVAARVRELLNRHRVPGHCLQLELSESSVALDTETAQTAALAVRRLGVTVAVASFGTGYSSMDALQRFEIDFLKIDRSFVSALHTRTGQEICRAIVAIGHALKMRVVAEGVETLEQRDMLALFGCAEAQGYLYAEPVLPGEAPPGARASWPARPMEPATRTAPSASPASLRAGWFPVLAKIPEHYRVVAVGADGQAAVDGALTFGGKSRGAR